MWNNLGGSKAQGSDSMATQFWGFPGPNGPDGGDYSINIRFDDDQYDDLADYAQQVADEAAPKSSVDSAGIDPDCRCVARAVADSAPVWLTENRFTGRWFGVFNPSHAWVFDDVLEACEAIEAYKITRIRGEHEIQWKIFPV